LLVCVDQGYLGASGSGAFAYGFGHGGCVAEFLRVIKNKD
jgi:hypothetical protein